MNELAGSEYPCNFKYYNTYILLASCSHYIASTILIVNNIYTIIYQLLREAPLIVNAWWYYLSSCTSHNARTHPMLLTVPHELTPVKPFWLHAYLAVARSTLPQTGPVEPLTVTWMYPLLSPPTTCTFDIYSLRINSYVHHRRPCRMIRTKTKI